MIAPEVTPLEEGTIVRVVDQTDYEKLVMESNSDTERHWVKGACLPFLNCLLRIKRVRGGTKARWGGERFTYSCEPLFPGSERLQYVYSSAFFSAVVETSFTVKEKEKVTEFLLTC